MFCQGAFAGADHCWSCVWLRANALDGRLDPKCKRLILLCPLDLKGCDFVMAETDVDSVSLYFCVMGSEGLPPYTTCLHPTQLQLKFSGHLLVESDFALERTVHENRMLYQGIEVLELSVPLSPEAGLVFSTTAGEASVTADMLQSAWIYRK